MLINYFRSSSYNDYIRCEMVYFLKYVLGLDDLAGKASLKGTIAHKVLEIMAGISIAKKANKRIFHDDIAGRIKINHYDIAALTKQIYDYFSTNSTHLVWKNSDYTDCLTSVTRVLEYNNGQFDPRKRDIIEPEMPFDFEIQEHLQWEYHQQ